MNVLFNWGDAVKVVSNAPPEYHPAHEGSVCGIRVIETANVADKFSEPVGTHLYLVEFSDGSSIEIPERLLTSIP